MQRGESVFWVSACGRWLLMPYSALPKSTVRQAHGGEGLTQIEAWHLHVQAKLAALALDDGSQVVDAELLGELVEDAELARGRRVVNRELHASHLRATPGQVTPAPRTIIATKHLPARPHLQHAILHLPDSACWLTLATPLGAHGRLLSKDTHAHRPVPAFLSRGQHSEACSRMLAAFLGIPYRAQGCRVQGSTGLTVSRMSR